MIQAGFGELLGSETLELIKLLGFDGVRLEASKPGLVEEVQAAGLMPVALVKDLGWLGYVPAGVDLEFVPCDPPEPDGQLDVKYYAQLIEVVRRFNLWPVWVGGISNLHRRGFDYMTALVRELGEDPSLRFTAHRYATGNSPETAHPPFSSRFEEAEALIDIIDLDITHRPFAVSEFGFCTGSRPASAWWRRLFGLRDRWTPEQVKGFIQDEVRFWRAYGAEWICLYQVNDGTDDSCEGTYGIRRADGTLKPASDALRAPYLSNGS